MSYREVLQAAIIPLRLTASSIMARKQVVRLGSRYTGSAVNDLVLSTCLLRRDRNNETTTSALGSALRLIAGLLNKPRDFCTERVNVYHLR